MSRVRRASLAAAVLLLAAACAGASPGEGSATTRRADTAPTGPASTVLEPSSAPRPSGVPAPTSVRIVSQNLLHGIACPDGTDRCALADRVDVFMAQLEGAGCPDVVAIQETDPVVIVELEARVGACGYHLVQDGADGVDRETVLTVLDVVDSRRIPLAGGFRSALAVRVDSGAGVLDIVTTHLASSSDNGACAAAGCQPGCDPARPVRECQARQLVELIEVLDSGDLVVVGGDLNATPEDPAYRLLVDGGFVDTHLAAGLAECAASAPAACTAGRDGTSMVDLTDPESRQSARIDHLFVAPLPDRCSLGELTGPFHPEPAEGPVAFASDHTAVALQLDCTPRSSVAIEAFPSTTTTVVERGAADEAVEVDVTSAFEGLFDGSIRDVGERLQHLERADELREAFDMLSERAGDLATATTVQVRSVEQTSTTTAHVVFDVLVDGEVAFEARVGSAVDVDGRWLVSAGTFCDLATTFAPDAPGC